MSNDARGWVLIAVSGAALAGAFDCPIILTKSASLRAEAKREILRLASKKGCKVIILGGTADRVVGTDAAHELNGAIPGSELYLYEGLGHAAYEEAPDFNRRVFDALESIP